MHMPGLMLDLSRAHAWGEAHSTAISSTDSILNMNESDLRSDVRYLGSSENKAWKKNFIHVVSRSSNIWSSYILNRLFITSRVYLAQLVERCTGIAEV